MTQQPKSLAEKLGFKDNLRVCCINRPNDYWTYFLTAPPSIQWSEVPEDGLDIIHYFEKERTSFEENLPWLRTFMVTNGCIWVSWPKKSSGWNSDITEDVIRNFAIANRLVDVKVVSINQVWSALKLVIPVKYRKV